MNTILFFIILIAFTGCLTYLAFKKPERKNDGK